jgi:hypothetical protein
LKGSRLWSQERSCFLSCYSKLYIRCCVCCIKNMTASKMRELLVQIVVNLAAYCLRGIRTKDQLFLCILTLCKWYTFVRSRRTTESDLTRMQDLGVQLRRSMQAICSEQSKPYDTLAVKHHVILHYPDLVRQFGSLLYLSGEAWEAAHRFMLKKHVNTHGSINFQEIVEKRVSGCNLGPNPFLDIIVFELSIYFGVCLGGAKNVCRGNGNGLDRSTNTRN